VPAQDEPETESCRHPFSLHNGDHCSLHNFLPAQTALASPEISKTPYTSNIEAAAHAPKMQ